MAQELRNYYSLHKHDLPRWSNLITARGMMAGVIVCFIIETLKLREIEGLDQDHTAGRERVSRLHALSLALGPMKGLTVTGLTEKQGEWLGHLWQCTARGALCQPFCEESEKSILAIQPGPHHPSRFEHASQHIRGLAEG